MPLRPSLDDSSQLTFLRDRVRSLERELLGLRGHADVWKSKADRGATREEYLMAELVRLSEELQCKLFFGSSCSSVLRMGLLALLLFCVIVAGAKLAPREEKESVSVRVNCLTQQDMEAGGFFWMDRDHAMALVTVQDRVHQVSRVLRQVQTSLSSVLHVMFPLDAVPTSLAGLLSNFRSVSNVKELVRQQLVAGVKVSLSLVRLHRPDVDLFVVAAGPPLRPDGGELDMRPHYAAVRQYAEQVVDLFEQRAQVILQHR